MGVAGRPAHAATGLVPYPVLQIFLEGGVDPAMHLAGFPAGRFGNVTVVNRPTSDYVTEPTTGIRYFRGTIAPTGGVDFQAHIRDVALLRAFKSDHAGHESAMAEAWFGSRFELRKPWGNHLASQFQSTRPVPKPCVSRWTDFSSYAPQAHYTTYGNLSPDPACAAERLTDAGSFFDSLSSSGLPSVALQDPVQVLIDALGARTYSLERQPDLTGRMAQAQQGAQASLRLAGTPPWPPPAQVREAFTLTNADLTASHSGGPVFRTTLAVAYQALAQNLSHVIAVSAGDSWDSHEYNIEAQINRSTLTFPLIGKLLTLMKATPSPIDPTRSLFDTTNIWIQSEMGRSAEAEMDPNVPLGSSGTAHWDHHSAIFLGGRFKRGKVIGDFGPDWRSVPIDPITGRAGAGKVMSMENMIATVMRAAGGDPAAYFRNYLGRSSTPEVVEALLDLSA